MINAATVPANTNIAPATVRCSHAGSRELAVRIIQKYFALAPNDFDF